MSTDVTRNGELAPDVALALEEYRSVRQEEMVAMQNQISTLRYGVTGCVVLIGVAAQQHADRYLGWAIALALVPLVILFSAVIWMGEYERMARAGHYVAIIEDRINKIKARAWLPFQWQGWQREGNPAHSRLIGGHHRYVAITCVFVGFQIAAVVMGMHFYWHTHHKDKSHVWLMTTAIVVNFVILVTLLGYFRSSYEHLRDFTAEPDVHRPVVRQRLRLRLYLYGTVAATGFLSAPFWSWPLGLILVAWFHGNKWLQEHSLYWVALLIPVLIWMVLVPLLASRSVMRELLSDRVRRDEQPTKKAKGLLKRPEIAEQLSDWERARLRVVFSEALNAPAAGRNRNVALTADALADETTIPGTLAHEVAHHRLHHLRPLALCYLYMWPYMYYDDVVLRKTGGGGWPAKPVVRQLVRGLWTLAAFPGWLGLLALRMGWRTAEYDADRFVCVSGQAALRQAALRQAALGKAVLCQAAALRAALERHKREREDPRRELNYRSRFFDTWGSRLEEGKSLGYLPIPNEHPRPSRRLKRMRRWEWSRRKALKTSAPAAAPEG